jgi:RNA polymerase sigma-70 factor, ECF subfamily
VKGSLLLKKVKQRLVENQVLAEAVLSRPHLDLATDFEKYRQELHLHCYRMTGSLEDADDLVQETFARALKALAGFRLDSSVRTWLSRIATNACIDRLRRRRRRGLPELASEQWNPSHPIPSDPEEDCWLQPYPTRRYDIEQYPSERDTPDKWYLRKEAVSLAFLTILQLLPPRQRAVFILREVLDWSAEEVADLFETSVAAVKSALHRARRTIADRTPAGLSLESSPNPTPAATDDLLSKYIHAWETLDIDGLVALLKDDAILAMPPHASWYRGKEAVATLLLLHPFGPRKLGGWRLVATAANGEPAFALYRAEVSGGSYKAFGILALSLQGTTEATIQRMTVYSDPSLPRRFGLPSELPSSTVQ